ncbi:MAG: hypothetical protein AB2L12_13560 [Smithellaceae bacterium]|jgi:hypothetical protein
MKKTVTIWIMILSAVLLVYWLCFGTEALRWLYGPLVLGIGK